MQSGTRDSITPHPSLPICTISLGTVGNLDTVYHQETGSGNCSHGLVGEGTSLSTKEGSATQGSGDDLLCLEHLEGKKQEGFRAKNSDPRGGVAGNQV